MLYILLIISARINGEVIQTKVFMSFFSFFRLLVQNIVLPVVIVFHSNAQYHQLMRTSKMTVQASSVKHP